MSVVVADIVSVCVPGSDKLGGFVELCRYSERHREVVCRTHRQIAYRNICSRAHQSVYSLVERAVSAAADNKVVSLGKVARYIHCVALAGGVFDGEVKNASGKALIISLRSDLVLFFPAQGLTIRSAFFVCFLLHYSFFVRPPKCSHIMTATIVPLEFKQIVNKYPATKNIR